MTNDTELAQEIFLLAYYLHWSKEEIMRLPIPERYAYLALLGEQLERETKALQERTQR